MSPFRHADKIARNKAPMLLIHGDDDQNSGTHPLQSDR
jgi:dipeptidyl aminopeptidase/acylaminoacyl peptidase